MVNILYLLGGVVLVYVVLPVLESLGGLLSTLLDTLTAKLAVSATKSKVAIQKMCNEQQQPHSEPANAIGFYYDTAEEEEDDEEV